MDILDLCGSWELSWEGCEKALPCTVPGSAAGTLLAHGMMPDPYWRDNETKVQQLLDRDYTFSRSFYLSANALRHAHGELCFHGLDTVH
jgi:beta-mannosidase